MKLAEVTWIDACWSHDFMQKHLDDCLAKETPMVNKTAGYVVYECDDFVVLAQELQYDNDNTEPVTCRHTGTIPWRCILSLDYKEDK